MPDSPIFNVAHPPTSQPVRERGRRWRIVFIAWNVLAALYLVGSIAVGAASNHKDCANTGDLHNVCSSAHSAGLFIASVIILVIWAVMSAILYMVWRVARRGS